MQRQILTGPPVEIPSFRPAPSQTLSLVILWSAREPQRVAQHAICETGKRLILGRSPAPDADEQALRFVPHRTAKTASLLRGTEHFQSDAELLGEALSRRQLELFVDGEELQVRNIGRCPLWVNGVLTGAARVRHGDTIHLQQQLLLLCVRRTECPILRHYPIERADSFGLPDRDGMVGESVAMWALREELAACAAGDGHVLVLGESGVGKELVAQTLHRLSARSSLPLVSENGAALSAGIGAALLFGNRRNFPNPGMEERKGLIGVADGGSLFLDEIGDLPSDLQPMLLRVMERSGEYIRLGEESKLRRANIRVIGATNHPERLRLELRRRFHHEITVPSLSERREDIPLLIRHWLSSQLSGRPSLRRFVRNQHPQIDPILLEQLVHHSYRTHVAELSFLLEQAAKRSPGDVLLPSTSGVAIGRTVASPSAAPTQSARAPTWNGTMVAIAAEPAQTVSLATELTEKECPRIEHAGLGCAAVGSAAVQRVGVGSGQVGSRQLPTVESAQRALDEAGGQVVRAAAMLSITRHQLNRMIRRNGLTVRRKSAEDATAHAAICDATQSRSARG